MANVNKLLHGAEGSVDLLAKLEPLTSERDELRLAKGKIRAHLKNRFAAIGKQAFGRIIEPRFFTQGSDSYRTLNRPPHMPPQQMDFDDGMYLPLSFMQEVRPSIAADKFFQIVDACLRELADQEGWEFDGSKATCARLVISKKAHVDIPLYAIPDSEFEVMAKAIRSRTEFAAADSAIDFDQVTWEELPSDQVLLAHREEGWRPSDPRKIAKWFREAVSIYGEQLRRECRYLKAWRDFHNLRNVSSLLLMVCVWAVYEEVGRRNMPSRDDLALSKIAARLPRLLVGPVKNPTDLGEKLDERMSDEERQAAIAKANELADQMNDIVDHCYNADVAVRMLCTAFGGRVPYRSDLVVVEKPAATVMRTAPIYTAAPSVGRSQSG